MATIALSLASVSKKLGTTLALDRVSLDIPSESLFAIVGGNGSGKTTLMRVMLGLLRPDSGIVSRSRVDGQTLRIGGLTDRLGLYDHLTGAQNLAVTCRLLGEPPSEIARVGALTLLDGALDRRVRAYSLGMRMKLAIARALIGDPAMLILDEPTNGLDPEAAAEITALFRRLVAQGKTVLLSSHLMGELEDMATHCALLDRGRLVAKGALTDLLDADDGVDLQTRTPDRARRLLCQQGFSVAADPDDRLIVYAPLSTHKGGEVAQIARMLVEAGEAIEYIGRRRLTLVQLLTKARRADG
jgi:lantibiotic transport system ATP-binding protein